MDTFKTACPRNCYSTCSFHVQIEDGNIKSILPNPDNKATPEGVCLKGLSYVERAHAGNRLLYPLQKQHDNSYKRISWDQAIKAIAKKLRDLKDTFGSHSILFYAASGMSGLMNDFSKQFWRLFGGVTTTYGNLCWPAGLEAVRLTLGENKHNVPWDLENAKLIVVWGKNPAETNIQQMIPIEKAQTKGANLIIIDPRRTPSAERADLLLQIKPGTDAALALGIANILIENNWIDHDFIKMHVKGFHDFKEHVKKYNLKYVAETTGIQEDLIQKFAEQTGKINPMTIIPGYGMQRFSNGGQTIRALLALSILTGNIGKQGACFHYANMQSYVFDSVKEPLSYYPSEADKPFRRSISTALLGEHMLAAINPKLKMMWVERGNPINQNPDTNKIKSAIESLDFMVVVDQFMTDTAKLADIVLPAKNMFEQSDIIGSYWNPYIQLKPKILEPAGEVKTELEIYHLLAKELDYSEQEIENHLIPFDDESILDYLKHKTEEESSITWEQLKDGPQLDESHEEIAFADLNFPTPSGKIELYSEQARDKWDCNELADYVPVVDKDKDKDSLYLLSPNTKNRIHSQFNNLEMIKQYGDRAIVQIHPKDALSFKVKHNEKIQVYNDKGQITAIANYDFGIKPGCVAVSNGWWEIEGGSINNLTTGRETDMGFGTAFHDTYVQIKKG